MMRSETKGLLVFTAFAVVGCNGKDDGSYEASLADLAIDLRVIVHVLGTSMPPTARRLQVELQPGPSATHGPGELCPVLHASGTVNGLPLRLRWNGGWKTYQCGVLLYDRELPADLPSELLGEKTLIELRDESAVLAIDILNIVTAPRVSWISPSDGALRPGAHAEILVEPRPEVLPTTISGYYTATEPRLSFGLSNAKATSSGLGFDIWPSASPSMGVVSFEGGSGFSAFGGVVTRCSGAQTCLAERSICGDTIGCEYGVAYGGGFDRLELPASVTLP